MKTRIKELIIQQKITSAQFASEIGIAASSLHHIVSGRNNPSLEVLQKIMARFPQINAEWLINGKGKQFKEVVQGELFEVVPDDKVLNIEESTAKQKLVIENGSKIEESIIKSISTNKTIEKLIVLYSDKSFDIYNS